MSSEAPTARFAFKLEDQSSGPALSAANALSTLKTKIDADTKSLREMQSAMSRLKGGTTTNTVAMKDLKDRITAQKQAIAGAQVKVLELGGGFGKAADGAKKTGSGLELLLGKAESLGGPLGGLASKFSSIGGLLSGGAIAVGILSIATAVIAFTAATVGAIGALLRYGIAQSGARREELLRLEGLTTLRNRMGIAAGNAGEMQEALDRVSESTTLGRDELARYEAQLYRTGLRGGNLEAALEGVAMTAQVQGDAMAGRFAARAAAAGRYGRSLRALTDDVKARLGGVAERQLLSLDVQISKLHENFSRIFDGLRLEGFLRAFREVTSLFSQNTGTGFALKTIFNSLFNPLLDGLNGLGPIARRFFQGLVRGALLVTLHLARLRLWFYQTFRGGASDIDYAKIALYAGVAVMGAFVAAALAVGAVLAVIGLAVVGLASPFIFLYEGVRRNLAAFDDFKATLRAVFTDTDWGVIGRSLVDGLVNGIRNGASHVVDAVRGLASTATSTLTGALGIHSPSRVFAEYGAQIPAGLAMGVESSAALASDSVDEMAPAPTGGGRSSTSSTISMSFGDIIVHGAGGDARETAISIRDQLARLLEGVSIHMGAPVPT